MSNKKKKNSNYQTAKRASSAAAAKNKKKKLSKDAVIGIICAAVILLAVVLTITFCAINKDKDGTNDDTNNTAFKGVYADDDSTVGKGACTYLTTRNTEGRDLRYVKMRVEGHGSIVLLLDATTAPISVNNFMNLVNKGFYNGLTFHRILENFMIQGGDPKADGTGGNVDENGDEVNIKGEFDNNGHTNDISHKRGVISMARSGNPYYPSLAYNTASSQFFICNADYPYLDGDYAAFGYVIAGLDVVDSITADGMQYTSSAQNGAISDKKNQPKIISVVEITEEEAMSYVK